MILRLIVPLLVIGTLYALYLGMVDVAAQVIDTALIGMADDASREQIVSMVEAMRP